MCTICSAFRPYETECGYAPLETLYASIPEVPSAPASTLTTNTMSVGDVFSGSLETVGDDDWIAVTLTAGSSYDIDLFGVGTSELSDPYLRLYNSSGTLVAQNDDGGQGYDSRLVFTPTTTGTYYVSARAYADGGMGDYQVTVAPHSSAPVGTLDELAEYLTDGYWSRHAFDTSSSNQIRVDLTALDSRGLTLARAALEAWESVADIEFVEVSSGAQITFSDDQAGAYSSYSAIGGVTQSAIVNVSTTWLSAYGSGYDDYNFLTYIHEIGHALGLGHQGPYNGSAAFGTDNVFANDSYQMSVMSYFSQTENTNLNASYALPITAMIADILAIQDLYGAPASSSATAGDTVYGLNQTIGGYLGQIFDIMASGNDPLNMLGSGPIAATIYDHSGTDTVDFSMDSTNQYIDLRSEGIWDTFGLVGNIVIARNTVIENYVAGSGDDWILGNNTANELTANGGQDTVRGLGGNDTINSGNGNDLVLGGVGDDVINGGDGNDTINGQADRDLINGGDGDDVLRGLFHEDTINGGEGNDIINGGSRDDVLNGGIGDDTVLGDEGNDLVMGASGNDTLRGGNGRDTLYGGSADDVMTGGDHSDWLMGDGGHDTISGNDGLDTINGGTGRDMLIGGAQADDFVFDAGFGRDTIADFEDDMDELYLDDALWSGTLTAQDIINTYGSSSNGNTVLNFGGGNLVVLVGVADAQDLVDDIVIF